MYILFNQVYATYMLSIYSEIVNIYIYIVYDPTLLWLKTIPAHKRSESNTPFRHDRLRSALSMMFTHVLNSCTWQPQHRIPLGPLAYGGSIGDSTARSIAAWHPQRPPGKCKKFVTDFAQQYVAVLKWGHSQLQIELIYI